MLLMGEIIYTFISKLSVLHLHFSIIYSVIKKLLKNAHRKSISQKSPYRPRREKQDMFYEISKF